jgi:deoxyadenosine/deoxycytidine kinase
MQIRESEKKSQDRTIYEDAHILHPTCMRWVMTNRDYQNYSLFELMESTVKAPD